MQQLFIVPACDISAIRNIGKSLEKKVNLQELLVRTHINWEERARTGKQRQFRMVNVWGTRENKKSVWEKMNSGDTVLYYSKKEAMGKSFIHFIGTVEATIDSPELAKEIWQEESFRYIHICMDTPEVMLEKEMLWKHLGYDPGFSVRGFIKVNDKKWEVFRSKYGQFKDYCFLLEEMKEETMLVLDSGHNQVEWKKPAMEIYKKLQKQGLKLKGEITEKPAATSQSEKNVTNVTKSAPDFMKLNEIRKIIGDIGEEIVYQIEKKNLINSGKNSLAQQVRIVSKESNQYGYDILSYDADGNERHIEVKTTSGGKEKAFEMSYREWDRMQTDSRYCIYRIYGLRISGDNSEIQFGYYISEASDISRMKAEPITYRISWKEENNGQ